MPTSKLVREVADYCWSNKFLDVFHKFFTDHAPEFYDAPELMEDGEHNMEYFALFQEYLVVYEKTLTDYLRTVGVSIDEFYSELRETQDETTDPYILTFIDCLLASCDYKSFYRVMAKEAKKRKPEAKAESKSERRSISAGGKDVDDDDDHRPDKKIYCALYFYSAHLKLSNNVHATSAYAGTVYVCSHAPNMVAVMLTHGVMNHLYDYIQSYAFSYSMDVFSERKLIRLINYFELWTL
eukprot:gene3595-7145_t